MDTSVEGSSISTSAEQYLNASSGIEVIPVGNMTETRDEQSLKQDVGSDSRFEGKTTLSNAVQFWNDPSVMMFSGTVICVRLVKPVKTPSVDVTEEKKRISSKQVTVFQSAKRPSSDVTAAASA